MSKTSNMMNYMAEKAVICEENCRIDYKLYDENGVKKGLRDKNGMGVLQASPTFLIFRLTTPTKTAKRYLATVNCCIGAIMSMIWCGAL